MDGATLRGAVEGAHRLGERNLWVQIARAGRDVDSVTDEGLRRRAARPEDIVPALGAADALEAGRGAGAGPLAGRSGQVDGTSRSVGARARIGRRARGRMVAEGD